MASGAQGKMVAVGMMLAIMFIAVANANPLPNPVCFTKTDEVPGLGECICSKNCACAGNCILNGGATAKEIQKCFVECVLKNDCYCKGGGGGPLDS
jgi:hypothetical protein